MDPGRIINSLFGSPTEFRCVHFGDSEMEFACSILTKIPDSYYLVCTEEEYAPSVSGVENQVGTPLDVEGKFDLVVVPGCYEHFSTALYMAIESILKVGGIMAITQPEMRLDLMNAMFREGAIQRYRMANYSNNEFWLFRLENGKLNREL